MVLARLAGSPVDGRRTARRLHGRAIGGAGPIAFVDPMVRATAACALLKGAWMAKVLSSIGVVALLAVGAVGIGGLVLVKDRVRIVITDDVDPVDPTALLRDDVHALRQDVAALSQALGDNLSQLVQALAEPAAQRHAELRGELAGLSELRRNAETTAARLAAIEARLVLLSTVAVTARSAPVPEPAPAPLVASTTSTAPTAPAAEPVPAELPVTPTVPAADTGAATPPPAAAPKPTFLSFQLPSRTFAFDREQQFEVVAELSRVGFDAKSTLHDFSGVTSKIHGELRANLADPMGAWSGAVRCTAATLVTGVDGRDAAMREHLDTDHHAEIVFAIERFAPAADGIDAAKQTVRGEVVGRMTIRGVEQPLRMPVTVSVDDSRRLVIEGEQQLRLPDYGVPVPSQLGVINMQDTVRIWIALRARKVAGADRGR